MFGLKKCDAVPEQSLKLDIVSMDTLISILEEMVEIKHAQCDQALLTDEFDAGHYEWQASVAQNLYNNIKTQRDEILKKILAEVS